MNQTATTQPIVATNSEVSVQNKTSSNVGENITDIVSISGVKYATTDQWIAITNNGNSNVSLTGWMLMNKENVSYSFPMGFVLEPGALVKVHSMVGNDNSTNLYNSSVLWNKNNDMAFLMDARGEIVSEFSYPAVSSNASGVPNVTVADNTNTTTSNVTTRTSKDITKITIVK